MQIDTEPVIKLPPEDILSINVQRCLLFQSSAVDKLVKNPSQIAKLK